MTAVPSISTVGKYAAIVVDKYMARSLIFASKDIIDAVNEGTEDANTLIDLAEQKIFDIRSGAEIKGLTHIGGILTSFTRRRRRARGRPSRDCPRCTWISTAGSTV